MNWEVLANLSHYSRDTSEVAAKMGARIQVRCPGVQPTLKFRAVQSFPSKNKVIWLWTKSSLQAACFSPLNQSLTLHASRWMIYNSVLDRSAYDWVLLQSEEITALFPFKHLVFYGPVLSAGLRTSEHKVPSLSLMAWVLEPQDSLVPNVPIVAYFYGSEKIHEHSCACCYVYAAASGCVWQLCTGLVHAHPCNYVYVLEGWVWTHEFKVQGGQKKVSHLLQLELQTAVSHPTWVLGFELITHS